MRCRPRRCRCRGVASPAHNRMHRNFDFSAFILHFACRSVGASLHAASCIPERSAASLLRRSMQHVHTEIGLNLCTCVAMVNGTCFRRTSNLRTACRRCQWMPQSVQSIVLWHIRMRACQRTWQSNCPLQRVTSNLPLATGFSVMHPLRVCMPVATGSDGVLTCPLAVWTAF